MANVEMVKFYKGKEANLPASRDDNSFYVTTDSGKLFLGDMNVGGTQGDWNQTNNTAQDYIKNKPPLKNGLNVDSMQYDGCVAGVKGFYWSDITDMNSSTPCIILSTKNGNFGFDSEYVQCPWRHGDKITIHNDAKWEECVEVEEVMGDALYVKGPLPFTTLTRESGHVTDQAVFCPAKPDQGAVDFGQYSAAFGDNCKAINFATFAAGRDNTSSGQYSTTFGRKNKTGYCGLTAGRENTNTGDHSIVAGNKNTNDAYAYASIVAGSGNSNKGQRALVVGTSNENYNEGVNSNSYGYNAFVSGESNYNEGNNALVIGHDNDNIGKNAIIGGYHNNSKSNGALVAGKNNTSTGGADVVLVGSGNKNNGVATTFVGGLNNTANHENVVLFGEGNTSTASHQMIIGKYTNSTSSTAFAIGNGTDAEHPSNAINVSKEGHTTISGRLVLSGAGSSSTAANSITVGIGCTNSGASSYLGGNICSNSGQNAIVSGYNCRSSSNGTLVMGNDNNSSGSNNILGGIHNRINGVQNSIVAGNTNIANHSHVAIFGEGNTSTTAHQTLLGSYSAPSSDTLFAIGCGGNADDRNNILEVTPTRFSIKQNHNGDYGDYQDYLVMGFDHVTFNMPDSVPIAFYGRAGRNTLSGLMGIDLGYGETDYHIFTDFVDSNLHINEARFSNEDINNLAQFSSNRLDTDGDIKAISIGQLTTDVFRIGNTLLTEEKLAKIIKFIDSIEEVNE